MTKEKQKYFYMVGNIVKTFISYTHKEVELTCEIIAQNKNNPSIFWVKILDSNSFYSSIESKNNIICLHKRCFIKIVKEEVLK